MKYVRIFIAAFLILMLLVPAVTFAAKPPAITVEADTLGYGEVRLDPYTTAKLVNTKYEKGQLYQDWEVTLGTLPQTLEDLKTKITVEWRGGMSDDGVKFWETGNNLFWARITGTRVSVEYEGILSAWDPTIYIGDNQLSLVSGPKKVMDPYKTDLGANTIEWIYESPGGLFSSSVRVLRYVRQIPGRLQEFYILEKNPGKSIRINSNYEEEPGFTWLEDVYAQDSRGIALIVSGSTYEKVVDFRELNRPELTYPVIIDPTSAFTSSYNIYNLYNTGSTYSTVRTASSGSVTSSTSNKVGQYYDGGSWYEVSRPPLYFNTGALPDNAIITGASIKLYGQYNPYGTPSPNFYITVQTGGTHPNRPPSTSDYYYSYYSGSGGTLYTSGWTTSGYNTLTLSSTGRSWISLTGYTEVVLRSSRDIDGNTPTGTEFVFYRSDSYGSGEPQLSVTYSLPVTIPDISTWAAQDVEGTQAELRGYLSDDGGADCDTWFEYGTTTSYGTQTPSEDGYHTGDSFDETVYGLDYGTLYHYTAKAQNSAGESSDEDEEFLTPPNKPTSFVVTPGDGQNGLTWQKGTGSDKTMIRRGTSSYPTSPTSGTQVYFDTGTSETDNGLTNGQTYYYSAWGYTAEGVHTEYSDTYATGSGQPEAAEPPTTTTYSATNVTTTVATLNGYLNYLGGDTSADCYFQYYWGAGTWADHNVTADQSPLSAIGSFSKTVSSLPADTLIHVRTLAINDNGQDTGSDVPFTTNTTYAPSIETTSSGGVTGESATLYGKVTDDGGYPGAVTVDFEWGLTSSYGENTGDGTGYSTDDTFQVTLDNLDPDTTYHFRARGWNSDGTGYGVDMNFTTDAPSTPESSTYPATDIGASSAMLHGQLTDDGDVLCDGRFTWSTNATLSVATNSSGWQTGLSIGDTYQYYVSNLTYDTTYYFRSEVKNGGGQYNATILSFTTVFGAPEEFIATPLTSTSIALAWEPQSDKTLIVAKTGTYPADRLDGSQVYFGPGSSTTYEGLASGTTYFFRAWSWRSGDNWSGSYAEDAATTLSTGGTEEIETPYDSANTTMPETPTEWWQGPGSSKIQNWPLVSYIDSIADGMGMDRGSMWAIFAGILAVLVGLIGAMIIPLRFAGFAAGLLGVLVLVGVGLISGWILAFYVVIGIALLILLPVGQGG